jgi:hypothetical protein
MPRVSYWMIRLALLHLLLGFTGGAWLLLDKARWLPGIPGLRTLHVELVLLGFMVLLAVSVAWWILPRAGGERPVDRGAWVAGVGFTLGVWLVGVGAIGGSMKLQWAGRLLELMGIISWDRLLWPRVLAAKSHSPAHTG